jgi:hypothetical protein
VLAFKKIQTTTTTIIPNQQKQNTKKAGEI